MADSIQTVIERVHEWTDAKEIMVSELAGGQTKKNYRVDVDGTSYMLRVPGANTEQLGIIRDYELAASKAAAAIGVGPRVFTTIQPEGVMITKFIEGRHPSPEEFRQPEMIKRLVQVIRRIHAMGTIPGSFSAFSVVDDYTSIALECGASFPKNFPWLLECKQEIENNMAKDPMEQAPCHNDLLFSNFLDDGDIRVLDWEYAGMNDPTFDLANFAVNLGLNEEQIHLLLQAYFGESTTKRFARLQCMRIMSDFREAMWGLVQIGLSKIKIDYFGYAEKHFDRLTQNLSHPQYKQCLKEVI